jgi:hypothetical protein
MARVENTSRFYIDLASIRYSVGNVGTAIPGLRGLVHAIPSYSIAPNTVILGMETNGNHAWYIGEGTTIITVPHLLILQKGRVPSTLREARAQGRRVDMPFHLKPIAPSPFIKEEELAMPMDGLGFPLTSDEVPESSGEFLLMSLMRDPAISSSSDFWDSLPPAEDQWAPFEAPISPIRTVADDAFSDEAEAELASAVERALQLADSIEPLNTSGLTEMLGSEGVLDD